MSEVDRLVKFLTADGHVMIDPAAVIAILQIPHYNRCKVLTHTHEFELPLTSIEVYNTLGRRRP
jgi:hypothetical protein